ncbi:MAG: hypothetical protein P1U89_17725 [Verrucomicrobiales bacterium]|nr:hypothetical protein [Verrucomicrobiales bacterium]
MEPSTTKEFDWFDKPKVRKGLFRTFIGLCILSIILQFTPPDAHHHGHFGEPWWVPAYAILGFAACAVIFLVAKTLGFVLKRKEDYWGVVEDETLPEDIDESIR